MAHVGPYGYRPWMATGTLPLHTADIGRRQDRASTPQRLLTPAPREGAGSRSRPVGHWVIGTSLYIASVYISCATPLVQGDDRSLHILILSTARGERPSSTSSLPSQPDIAQGAPLYCVIIIYTHSRSRGFTSTGGPRTWVRRRVARAHTRFRIPP